MKYSALLFLFLISCSVSTEQPSGSSARRIERSISKDFGVLAGSDSDYFPPVYPNPFSRATGDQSVKIEFSLADSARAIVLIQNPIGEEIVRFQDSLLKAGGYNGAWDPVDGDGEALDPGLYFVTVNIRHTNQTGITRPNYIQSRMLQILNN